MYREQSNIDSVTDPVQSAPSQDSFVATLLKTVPHRVSIVLYVSPKGTPYVEQAIECCLGQTYRNLELIVVDDTPYAKIPWEKKTTMYARYSDDPRFLLIRNKKTRGLGRVLNQGFKMANGKYLTWIRDIHLLHDDAVEKLVAYFEQSDKSHFVYTDYHMVDPKTGDATRGSAPDCVDVTDVEQIGPCFMYTKELFETLGRYQESYESAADIAYGINIIEQYRAYHYHESLCSCMDVPYYIPKMERVQRFLFRRFLLYRKRYISLESLESGVEVFKNRIKDHAKNTGEYFFLLLASVCKMYRMSFRSGILYQAILAYVDHRDKLNLTAQRQRRKEQQKRESKLTQLGAATRRASIVIYSGEKGEKHLQRAVESCLSQTYPYIEVIVVDDGSRTEERSYKKTKVFRKYRKDSRLFVIRNKKTRGLGRALNQGFAKANGQYCTWIKDINFLEPQMIETMVRYFDENPGAQFVYSDYRQIDAQTETEVIKKVPDHIDYNRIDELGPSFLYTKVLSQELGRYRQAYGAAVDIDYWHRIIPKHRMRYYPEALCANADVPYYGKRLDRIYRLLLRKFILYREGYITKESLQNGIVKFQERLRDYARTPGEFFSLIGGSIIKMYRISVRMGLLYQSQLFYLNNRKRCDVFFKPFKAMHKGFQMFLLGCKLKTNNDGKDVLCLIPKVVLGGAEKVIRDIVQQAGIHSHHFHLLAFKGENNRWCRQFLRVFDNTVLMNKGISSGTAAFNEEYYRYLKFLVRKLNIRIVLISNSVTAYGCLDRLKKDFPEIKVVDLLHAEKFVTTRPEAFKAVSFIDRRVCISNRLENYLKDEYQVKSIAQYVDRIDAIHNANDMEFFQKKRSVSGRFKAKVWIRQDAKIISYIGRLAAEKRPLVFLDVAREVLRTMPDEGFKFVIAGDGYQRKVVEERIKEYGMEEDVIVLGTVRNEGIRDLLNDSFVVLITSSEEGLPLVAVEAMAMSVPVICTDVGAVREAIEHAVNGFIVSPRENVVESFVDCIQRLASSDDVYSFICKNARASVAEKFSLGAFGRRYLEIFAGCINGSNGKKGADTKREKKT